MHHSVGGALALLRSLHPQTALALPLLSSPKHMPGFGQRQLKAKAAQTAEHCTPLCHHSPAAHQAKYTTNTQGTTASHSTMKVRRWEMYCGRQSGGR